MHKLEDIHYIMKWNVKYEKCKKITVALELKGKKGKKKKFAFACGAQAVVTFLLFQRRETEVDAINGQGNSLKGVSVDMCY